MWWGEDNFEFGWPRRHPRLHDILCKNVVLVGKNFTTADLLPREPRDKAVTGAYTPFGVPTEEGQVIHGMVPCSGAIMGVPLRGGEPKVVAWGLRNPFGLGRGPDRTISLASHAVDVALAAIDGPNRVEKRPWLPLMITAKKAAEAAVSAR